MRPLNLIRRVSLAVLLSGATASVGGAQELRPRILVSNDDGIASEGIAAVAAALSDFADVVVVAPDGNRSGSSHQSIVRQQTTTMVALRRGTSIFGYSVDATPADAVKIGILEFGRDRPFDLVVSGINSGANVGMVAHTSGTVGAAVEAVLNGIPAIAVSQGRRPEYTTSANLAARVVREALSRGMPPGVLLSINVPSGEPRGLRLTPMGGLYFRVSGFEAGGMAGDSTRLSPQVGGPSGVEPESDTAAYLDGYVTITPIRIDWTDSGMLRELGAWDLDIER